MKLFNRFFRKKQEKKDFTFASNAPFGDLYRYYMGMGNYLMAKTLAISFYNNCSPIFHAVKKIATAISALDPLIYDKNTKTWIDRHPILDLLQKPNADITWKEFIYAYAAYYLIAGDSYITSSGFDMKPPKEIFIYPANAVTIIPGNDGLAQTMQTTMYWGSDIYSRDEINKRFRWFNAARTSQIWQMKTFNTVLSQGNVYGMPILNPIYFEINQHQASNRHNLSLLERGATPSGIMSINPMIDDSVFKQLLQDWEANYAGSANAGRVMLLNGIGEYKQTSITPKDMDFLELKKEVTNSMYRVLDIPLALVNTESMTLDNITTSTLMFYDDAVLPLAHRIFEELTNFLMPMYEPNKNNLCINFNIGCVEALEPRRNIQLKLKKDLNIYTINELRAEDGAEPIDGGASVYASGLQMPIATDPTDTSKPIENVPRETNEEPKGNESETTKPKKTTRSRFTEIMKGKLDADGNPVYTDEEINKLADKHGLN